MMTPKFILFLTVGGILCSCGIKGRPLPPENNVVNINQLQNTVEPVTPATATEDTKKTDTKKTKKK